MFLALAVDGIAYEFRVNEDLGKMDLDRVAMCKSSPFSKICDTNMKLACCVTLSNVRGISEKLGREMTGRVIYLETMYLFIIIGLHSSECSSG